MADPVQLAKEARQKLAAALSALQAAGVPDELVEAAEPVAQAMGVLHRIERTNGENLEGRKDVVDAVRTALSRVQAVESSHPAVDVVMEAIAGSLSKVHALLRYEPVSMGNPVAPSPPVPPTPPAVSSAPAVAPAPQPFAVSASLRAMPAVTPQWTIIEPRPAPQPVAQPVPVPVAAPAHATLPITDVSPQGPGYAQNARRETPPVLSPQLIQAARSATPVADASQATVALPVSAAASAAPAPQAARGPTPQPLAASTPASAPSASPAVAKGSSASAPQTPPSRTAATRPAASAALPRVDVELGTNSTSNFYKGLGGNDVIEHGGIFVATYKVLKINTDVTLHVLLPGDYEFTAVATVQWTREGGTSEPGYGARFTQISAEGRQLVYRYTRNREPMFYDDL